MEIDVGTQRRILAKYIITDMFGKEAKLDFWQSLYLARDPVFFIANKSRRVGWSFITAMKGLLDANDPKNKRYVKQFVSYSHDDAKEKILFAKEMFESLPKSYRKKMITRSKTALEFLDSDGKSVSRLISHPCKPVRGKGGVVSLDEFAFHAKADEIYVSALPAISRGGSIEIGSTPFGNSGRFYEILTGQDYREYVRVQIPWYYCASLCTDVQSAMAETDLTTEARVKKYGTDILKKILQSMPLVDFQQEYECLFRDEQASYITLEMIQSCIPVGDNELIRYESIDELLSGNVFRDLKPYHPDMGVLYAGYDVGRTHDASELTIFAVKPDSSVKYCIASISYRNMPFDEQEKNLMRLLNYLPVKRLCIDATGLGMPLAEKLVKKKDSRKLKLLTLRIRSKKNLRPMFILRFSEGSMCCLLTESLYHRYIQSGKLLPLPDMCALMLKAVKTIMQTSSGALHLLNMRQNEQKRLLHSSNSYVKSLRRKKWKRLSGTELMLLGGGAYEQCAA